MFSVAKELLAELMADHQNRWKQRQRSTLDKDFFFKFFCVCRKVNKDSKKRIYFKLERKSVYSLLVCYEIENIQSNPNTCSSNDIHRGVILNKTRNIQK